MTIEQLIERSGSLCELCDGTEQLQTYEVPAAVAGIDNTILLCKTCMNHLTKTVTADENHWRCLSKSMWSPVTAVQVVAWRLLYSIRDKGWPQDLLDMLYLDDETLAWAKSNIADEEEATVEEAIHKDSNGTILQQGDTVVLIKDLNVKGGGFTAKRGTAVRGIALVADNPQHIEGKVNGQQIVILTQYVKKSAV